MADDVETPGGPRFDETLFALVEELVQARARFALRDEPSRRLLKRLSLVSQEVEGCWGYDNPGGVFGVLPEPDADRLTALLAGVAREAAMLFRPAGAALLLEADQLYVDELLQKTRRCVHHTIDARFLNAWLERHKPSDVVARVLRKLVEAGFLRLSRE